MVPVLRALPLDRFIAFVFHHNGTLLLAILLLLMLGWHLAARDLYKGFFLALTVFNMQPLSENMFRRFSNTYKMVHVAILFSCFIAWNERTGALTRAIGLDTRPQQIYNLADFLESQLRIMVTEGEVEMYFDKELLPKALKARLLVVNASTVLQHRNSLNTSYAYCASDGAWRVVSFQQSRLDRPRFRRLDPHICTSPTIRQIPMSRNSPFREKLYQFYMNMRINGFYTKWEEESFRKAARAGLVQVFSEVKAFASMNLNDYMILIKSYFICIGICVLCLICEIIWKNRDNLRAHSY